MGAHWPEHQAERFLFERLHALQQSNSVPLISTDLDDTLLPFGAMIGGKELAVLTAYLETGAHIVFNTLAPKEWFYFRVVGPMAGYFHRKGCLRLLRQVHWIASGGKEIFVYGHSHHSYRRVYTARHGSKAEGLLHLMRHLGGGVAILALYGDRFDDSGNDGDAIGQEAIPLIVNVGADQQVPRLAAKQVFINTAEKGPPVTLSHLAFLTEKLNALSLQVISSEESAFISESPDRRQPWRFELANLRPWQQDNKPVELEVEGPGFVWSWNGLGASYVTLLIPLVDDQPDHKSIYRATLPEGVIGFTFFWTGGDDTKTGQSAGHWEGRDFAMDLNRIATSAAAWAQVFAARRPGCK
jgi:hypothetical protein